MDFLEKIKPYIVSNDVLIQETVLHALHDYPNVPEEWTIELLKEAFKNEDKRSSILIYVENMKINENAVKVLLENIPLMDKTKNHLAVNLLNRMDPELALKYKEALQGYISEDSWSLYELIMNGTEDEVFNEFLKTIHTLDNAETYQHPVYIKAKKLAACIVQNGWITEEEIDIILQEELNEQWFTFNGILTVYMIGLMKLEKHIPLVASFLDRDYDILLEEVSSALIGFQSDEVVKAVAPYLINSDSIIYASSVIENIKSDHAVEVLREAYRSLEELQDQDILIEALCHQLSNEALPEISDHMKKEYFSSLVDIEQTVYSYYTILGEQHPELMDWKLAALEREIEFRNVSKQGGSPQSGPVLKENKVGRNDPCPCGSGKKYKKCCGK
ncbi:SEC-C metal-binding domain-containing protein [Neobacillus sp. OS1-33]|uniref:YecA family protein n=1 Tax=Neobacillus sp. OS1-33 TaxID=3070683 RepID=UPI0027E1D15F|nr:SEC-C metal-binding domain-containing protein [Neobacillus sp. OS1-33]WML26171.1 SEC-C metal-binding domain-containing protein [Neobacillus sp. OS1-33]